MVRLSDLTPAPIEEKKKYIFQTGKTGGSKKEWQMERERRKARAQKKEQRRKNMDEAKEQEKSKWKNFNAKAESKSLKVVVYFYTSVLVPEIWFAAKCSIGKHLIVELALVRKILLNC